MRPGDLLMFVDWRGDPDQRLAGLAGQRGSPVLSRAASRGVLVRGLGVAFALDDVGFSARENRHLDEEVNQAGGCCLLDMRVRFGGSHHQKFVVLRHPGRPELDVAYVGGIDLCHSRRDDAAHEGDPQRQPMAAVYGSRPPWHDAQVAVSGPAVSDVETVSGSDGGSAGPSAAARSGCWRPPPRRGPASRALPSPLPPPPPAARTRCSCCGPTAGAWAVTRSPRNGERSVARGYGKALSRARHLISTWRTSTSGRGRWATRSAAALRRQPGLYLVAGPPALPRPGRQALDGNPIWWAGTTHCWSSAPAAPDRVAVYGVENHAGTPVYVHAKVCVIDDEWASVGSDNFNRRSWTHDSELSVAVWDTALTRDGVRRYPVSSARTGPRAPRPQTEGDRPGPRRSRRSRSRRPRCRPGTTAGASAGGRRAGYGRCRPRRRAGSPGCGPARSTGRSTTPTRAR